MIFKYVFADDIVQAPPPPPKKKKKNSHYFVGFWKVETKFIENLWKGMDLNWDHLYYFCVAYDDWKSR